MGGLVVNCKKCNKVFQQRLYPICVDCLKLADEQFKLLYRRLQDSASEGGIAIDVLAMEIGMEQEEIERLYLEGRLSIAGTYLRMPCPICGILCDEKDRKGRFCLKCSEVTAHQAGVDVKTLQELDLEESETKKQQLRIEAQLKKHTSTSSNTTANRFGSMFRH